MGYDSAKMYLPALSETGWGSLVNDNFSRLGELGFNVKAFGALGDGSHDDTSNVQDAIDAAFVAGGGLVFFPAGNYLVSTLTLKTLVSLVGTQNRKAQITAKTGAAVGLLQMGTGEVQQMRVENIGFVGNASNTGQHCFYLYAQSDGVDGGLWYSTFRNVQISGFPGAGIWLRGGYTGSDLPHQFNVLDNVVILRAAGTTSRCLLLTGQVGQTTVIGGEFDGTAEGTGTNIELSRQFTNGGTVGGFTVGGAADGDRSPYSTVFLNITSQTSDYAFQQDRAATTSIVSGFFENLDHAINIQSSSLGNVIQGCTFTNAAQDGGGTGYAIRIGVTASANIVGNYVLGTVDKFLSTPSTQYGVKLAGNFYEGAATGLTSGYTVQFGESGGVLTTYACDSILLNPSATTIDTITSSLMPGDDLTIRLHTGAPGYAVFGTGGNITLPNALPVQIRPGDVAVFTRVDLGGTWVLKSLTRVGGADVIATASLPAAGADQNGRIVIEDGGAGDRNLIIYAGGQRFRIDGGANV